MITKKETKQLAKLLKKIDNPHLGLPQSVFDALIKVVPFVAVELAVVNDKKEILLTWREDKWWRGWHFPGGLLRFRESFDERLQKVAWNELGINISSYKHIFMINYTQGKRGHGVSLMHLCRTKMKPKDGKFFAKMPRNIILEHKDVWGKVKKHLK